MSRLTRGVVVLMCDERSARSILAEGRRLNMVDGHFVWLWLDTRAQHDDPPLPASSPAPPPGAPPGPLQGHAQDDDWGAAARRPRGIASPTPSAAAPSATERRRPAEEYALGNDWLMLNDLPATAFAKAKNSVGDSVQGGLQAPHNPKTPWAHTPRGSKAPPPPLLHHRGKSTRNLIIS